MAQLPSNLRRDLERSIIRAREIAGRGSREAIEALTVHEGKRGSHVTSEADVALRNHLRAHARQIGDRRNSQSGTQAIDRLVQECAYEHWHRMIFARFLAENSLLVEPDSQVAVSLDDVEELARDEGIDRWELAGKFAQHALPAIFRPDDPLLQVRLPREVRLQLDALLDELPRETFLADDSLGWVYQFWQSSEKERVNKEGEKITGETLSAVPQLFTEHYMVLFLLHNTLGAWHAGKVLAGHPELANSAKSEAELREALRLTQAGGYDFEYLRFVKVDEASSLVPPPPSSTTTSLLKSASEQKTKSLEGSSTLEFHWFDWHEPIEVLSGNLPHLRQEGCTYFVTFRTVDSLPAEKWKTWLAEREQWLKEHPEPHDKATKAEYFQKFPQRIHHWLDQEYGACVLRQEALRTIVEDALRHFDGDRYRLDEFVVAANHVHVLVTPLGEHELSDILHSWKSFTANKINKALGQTGAFWQKESFDHAVRSPDSMVHFRKYIRNHNVDAASSRVLPSPQPTSAEIEQENKSLEGSSTWRPMGGTFDGWPKCAAELKVLDPCCGSGHFLVAAFELLVRLRMLEEGLSVEAAVDAVIQDNLFGLELDPRCTQIAAFNVAVAAWKLTGPRPLPAMKNIACTGLSVGVPRDQWMKALESDGTTNLRFYFGQLYDMFSNASTLGSLINPNRFLGSQMLKKEDMERLFSSLETVIASDPSTSPEQHELGIAAQGMQRAAELLAGEYHVVLTNVPYLRRGKQDRILGQHLDEQYALGKADLATAFVLRSLEFCSTGGTAALVTPQNWLFLTTYKKLRESLLENRQWNFVAKLGTGAFETIGGHVVNVALLGLTAENSEPNHLLGGIDVSDAKQPNEKAMLLRGQLRADFSIVAQADQLKNPDARLTISYRSNLPLLEEYAETFKGICSGDSERFRRCCWEISASQYGQRWAFQQSTPDITTAFAGREAIFLWDEGSGEFHRSIRERLGTMGGGAWIRGKEAWGRRGVAVKIIGSLPVTTYEGTICDNNVAVVVPRNDEDYVPIWVYCFSGQFADDVRKLNRKLSVTDQSFVQVPFDLAYWQQVAAEKYPDGLPEPESDDPTQWLFHGWPGKVEAASSRLPADCKSLEGSSTLQVAIARLLGYRWPAELDPEMRLSDRARQLVQSCEELLPFADEHGIVCIPSVRGEDTAAARLTRLLEACKLKPPHKLDDWLRNDFFKEHCELFQQRPFIWHIWDGRKADGFHALVNYHKLCGVDAASSRVPSGDDLRKSLEGSSTGRKLLENLTYSYLGDWINRQESDVKRGESGADGRLAAARTLQQQLIAILKGEPPYDIFVRWKPLHEQPIGWNPDINDGVRINIRPFMAVDIPGGRKDSGILRWGPKIKWTKDRGKEPKRPRDEYPWFWGWDEQTIDFPGTDTPIGDRWNDCHYTNAFKQAAREKKEGKS